MTDKTVNRSEPTTRAHVAGQARGAYDAPRVFPIGDARELLRGSGRHKNDDTGSRGFTVG